MHIYIQWGKDNVSTLSSQILSILRLPRFEKLYLSQFQLYIEAQTVTQYFLCRNCKNTIVVRADAVKEKVFCIWHMLKIHTGLQKLSETNLFDLHQNKMNPFCIHEPYINIANNELLFQQYIMSLHWERYDIKVQNNDAIIVTKYSLISCNKRAIYWMDYIYVKDVFW